jgi:hypothetical protein
MKFGIAISTYQRPDGMTPLYLRRAMDFVLTQTHSDYKLYVIGDKYENNDEFLSLVESYKFHMDLYYENFPVAVEREKYKDNRMAVWCTAGTNVVNYIIDKALNEGIEYICHLDHDDYWNSGHLKAISDAIERTNAEWFCTKSVYGNLIYPVNESEKPLVPFLPMAGGVIHSSVCCNYKRLPFRYRDTYSEGAGRPADADLWDRLRDYIMESGLQSYLINQLTCYHHEEGYLIYGR